jgi:hypothetical protein
VSFICLNSQRKSEVDVNSLQKEQESIDQQEVEQEYRKISRKASDGIIKLI